MNIIIGHSNTDNDCFGSMALMKSLYPDSILVRSSLIHPVAKNLYSLYADVLDLKFSNEINPDEIEKIIIVDTRNNFRIKEFSSLLTNNISIEIWDHHINDTFDIENATVIEGDYGANTTLVGLEIINKGIALTPSIATIALAGIYADTGNFTHSNVKYEDFLVSSFLINQKADVSLVSRLVKTLSTEHQISIFHDLLNHLEYKTIKGNSVVVASLELETQIGGLASVVEQVFEIENPDAFFAIFSFEEENTGIIIARSHLSTIPVNMILKQFNGGGHILAASAQIKNCILQEIKEKLLNHVSDMISNAPKASDIMSIDVKCLPYSYTMREASEFLENINHTGCPVIDKQNKLIGFLSLRDIMKARKISQMHAPITAYMKKKVIYTSQDTSLKEIENLLRHYNISHLPIVQDSNIIGIITRSDLLNYYEKSNKQNHVIHQNTDAITRNTAIASSKDMSTLLNSMRYKKNELDR